MKPPVPDSIASRTLLVLIVGLTLSHVLSMGFFLSDRHSAQTIADGLHIAERIALIERLAETASPTQRRRILELADSPTFHVFWSKAPAIDQSANEDGLKSAVRASLVDDFGAIDPRIITRRADATTKTGKWPRHLREVHPGDEPRDTLSVSLQIKSGGWLNFAVPIDSMEPAWSVRFVLSMLVMLLAIGVFSAIVVHHLTRPLATFARAAQRLGVDVKAPPLPEVGPSEVIQAARAFNEMQGRIQRFVDDRTQMIAAISHDLGTPITRMRLRAEFVDDEEQKSKMLADLDDMERMVFSTLSFARDESSREPQTLVDFRSLLQRVRDDLGDTGHAVTLSTIANAVPLGCRPTALRRALSNLVENAARYGGKAVVSMVETDDTLCLSIDDDGPGIPVDLREEVFKPFRRLETSRGRETGGTGLGLTVARTIIRAHGGDVTLEDRPEGGLRVNIRLPK